ncbi:hypothetical protein JTE90_029682 [Oedothorax gibbosus]|uniref:ABC-type xenobiotic transporter n=1 Tax=Oedothorax gibbosus TaxID=931172 RepID=A0AAV6U0G8_9ARAC|nr:hypothetical protein JTE90_029682 [Oedothorax gibbosus]
MSVLSGSTVGSDARLRGLQSQGNIGAESSCSHASISSTAEESFHENSDDDLGEIVPRSQLRLWKLSASEWPYILVGGIAAVLMGILHMVQPILFGAVLGVLSDDPKELTKKTDVYCIALMVISVTTGLFCFLQVYMFAVAGETITSRLRKMVFSNIISQDLDFFDHPQNSVGSLCSRLTSDAASVQGATGFMISTLFQATTVLVASIGMAFWFEYKIGLVVLTVVPCIWFVYFLGNRKVTELENCDRLGTEKASKVAIEAIESIRTVASLHQEETILLKFQNHLQESYKISIKQSQVRGLVCGLTQGFFTGVIDAFLLLCGSRLVANMELHYGDLLKVLESMLPLDLVIGQAVVFTLEYQKAKLATKRIFQLLDKKPKIDAFSKTGKSLEYVNGHTRFRKVYFAYSSRPTVQILSGLDLDVEPGKTVALVGSSGCGKSTCVQLMERFYEPQSGSVLLDGTDVGEINVSNLRSHIGLVSQEPVLFSYSIAENIAYGDNSRHVNIDEIIEAARKANIHNFISTLPQGYETPVGDKGTQLSGGQKQRIAIARALLRNPKILILDEATSALDAESEQIVQDALNKARSGRTCFIIAHRLTTVQNADVIMVMQKGRIVDKGTHEELLHRKGLYYKMHNTQSSEQHFFWPQCYKEIEDYVRSCGRCQRVGKPFDKKKAPMKIVPVIQEVFSKINVDACGPLPVTTSGKRYLLTAMCLSSKYPDAVPVEDITSVTVVDALLQIFSRMGFPKVLQLDQGSSFTSALSTTFLEKFGIKVVHSSVYHPQSNPIERFHRTVKIVLKVLCLESGSHWEQAIYPALFALRTVTHESTGFTPVELVHGKNLRTPLTLLYEKWLDVEETEGEPVTEYVFSLINRMKRCQELAISKMEECQQKNKTWYDKKAVKREF